MRRTLRGTDSPLVVYLRGCDVLVTKELLHLLDVHTGVKQKREQTLRVWIDAAGNISIQDKIVAVEQVEDIMINALTENPILIVAFNADHRTPAGIVHEVMEELKRANAIRVSFTSDPELRGGR